MKYLLLILLLSPTLVSARQKQDKTIWVAASSTSPCAEYLEIVRSADSVYGFYYGYTVRGTQHQLFFFRAPLRFTRYSPEQFEFNFSDYVYLFDAVTPFSKQAMHRQLTADEATAQKISLISTPFSCSAEIVAGELTVKKTCVFGSSVFTVATFTEVAADGK